MHSGTDEVLGGSIAGMMENYWGAFWFMVAVIWKYCGYIECSCPQLFCLLDDNFLQRSFSIFY